MFPLVSNTSWFIIWTILLLSSCHRSSCPGNEVLNTLSASTSNYDILNRLPETDGSGGSFSSTPGEKGGRIKVNGVKNLSFGTIAHELFHGYQKETGLTKNSTITAEIGAYLFQEVVSFDLNIFEVGAPSPNTGIGNSYSKSFNNLLFKGYTDHDYINANILFKAGSEENSRGLYNRKRVDFRLVPSPAIKKFLPIKF